MNAKQYEIRPRRQELYILYTHELRMSKMPYIAEDI